MRTFLNNIPFLQIPKLSLKQHHIMYEQRRSYLNNLQRIDRNLCSMIKHQNIKKNLSTLVTESKGFTHNNNKPINLVIDFDNWDLDVISNLLDSKLMDNIHYTCFVKLRFSDDTFRMVGNQFGFTHHKSNNLDLLNDITEKIHVFFDNYNMFDIEDVISVYIRFNELDDIYINTLKVDDKLITKSNSVDKRYLNSVTKTPVCENHRKLGVLLNNDIDKNNNIVNISFKQKDGKIINLLDRIIDKSSFLPKNHPDKISVFDFRWEFIHVKENNREYILALRKNDNNITEKYVFTMSGMILSHLEDKHLDNGFIERKSGNNLFIINIHNKIISSEKHITLKKLAKSEYTKRDLAPIYDPNIGVIDCETFKDINDGVNKIFCLGFKTNLNDKPVIYYVNDNINSEEIIIQLFDEILRYKYSDVKFLIHNGGNYDLIFMINALCNYNERYGTKYHLSFKHRDDTVISLTVKLRDIKNNKSITTNSVTINDSYCLLTSSLSKLGNDFKVDTLKSVFPHKFSQNNTLFYKGNTPDLKYFSNITLDKYYQIKRDDWSFKDECIKYLMDDINSLYEVIIKSTKQVWDDYKINMTDSLTISGLAIKLFTRDYYQNYLPIIDKKSMYNDIKEGYYGGITEVYKPYGENLYYYDVNSLYPFIASKNAFPGLNCIKHNFSANQSLKDLFGFYKASIVTPTTCYIGVLPVRTPKGLIFPLGEWTGWYFSEELKFAEANGYKIELIEGYSFNKVDNVFTKYVDEISKNKINPINNTQKSMAKSLLNNLLGRFGINLEKQVTEIVTVKQFDKISAINKVSSYAQINHNNYIVTYYPSLDYDVIKDNELDFSKIATAYSDTEIQTRPYCSITTSAAVTSYARIYISKLKQYIMDKGGTIYYSDTDSIVTDIELPTDMLDKTFLGKLKLEHKIKKGVFISGKTYGFINDNNVFINKAKGLKSDSLSYNDYLNMLWGKDNIKGRKISSLKDWSKGHVDLTEKNVSLDPNAYKGRTKIYDYSNVWNNTLPLSYNETNNTSLINFIPKELTHVNRHTSNHNKYTIGNSNILLIVLLLVMCYIMYFISYLFNIEDTNTIEENYNTIEQDNIMEINDSIKSDVEIPLTVKVKRLLELDEDTEYDDSPYIQTESFNDDSSKANSSEDISSLKNRAELAEKRLKDIQEVLTNDMIRETERLENVVNKEKGIISAMENVLTSVEEKTTTLENEIEQKKITSNMLEEQSKQLEKSVEHAIKENEILRNKLNQLKSQEKTISVQGESSKSNNDISTSSSKEKGLPKQDTLSNIYELYSNDKDQK